MRAALVFLRIAHVEEHLGQKPSDRRIAGKVDWIGD